MSEFVTVTVTRSITAAAGVYAPGHVGELTRYLPFELVDDVLSETKTVQRRLRDLPSRVGVYFVLALMLFSGLGYARVWRKLTAGLVGLELPSPSEKALRDLRRRLGPAPFKALFEVVAGPLGQPHTPGVCYRGMRTVAFDGCNSLKVPDTDRNRSWLGRIRYRMGFAGYPTIRMMALIETGTRAILGATLGSAGDRDEATLARRLLPLLQPNMLVLLDRAFDAAGFCKQLHGTSAKFLVRSRATRRPPVLAHLSDGSFLSDLHGLSVRIIDAELTVTGADGSRVRDRYRLITTLLDHHNHPAAELVRLYHERWEIEIAYLELRHTILHGRVLRSQDRAGLEQQIWALLTVYQLLRMAMVRMAMVTAVESHPDTNPTGPASLPLFRPPGTNSSPPTGFSRPTPTSSERSAAPFWAPCCHHADRAGAPGSSRTPPRATSTATTGVLTCRPPSPRSTLPYTHLRSTRLGGPGIASKPTHTLDPPDDSAPRPSWKETPSKPGAGVTSPSTSVSNPATCSPNSPNGPDSASSPAQPPAATRSRPAATSRVLNRQLPRLTTRHWPPWGLALTPARTTPHSQSRKRVLIRESDDQHQKGGVIKNL
jgi:hypothetical protein